MKLSFDFKGYQPPSITERQLVEILQQRKLAKQALLLVIASVLIYVCLALLAFAIAPLYFEVSVGLMVFLGISLANSGVLAVLLTKRLSPQYRFGPVNQVSLEL